jgi:uncharacterized membrane protein
MTDASSILLFLLSIFGFFESMYLTRKRMTKQAPACPIGSAHECTVVLESEYNHLFGLHNDVLGILFYASVFILAGIFLWFGNLNPLLITLLKILIGVSGVMSLVFTYLQWKVIKAWCFWCLCSAFTTWAMCVIVLWMTQL